MTALRAIRGKVSPSPHRGRITDVFLLDARTVRPGVSLSRFARAALLVLLAGVRSLAVRVTADRTDALYGRTAPVFSADRGIPTIVAGLAPTIDELAATFAVTVR